MNQILYLDVFFLTNFIINETLLVWLRIISGKYVGTFRILCGGMFASGAAVVMEVQLHNMPIQYHYIGLILQMLCMIGIVLVMLWIVYGKMEREKYKSCLLNLFLGTVIYAGILMVGNKSRTEARYFCANVVVTFPMLCVKSVILLFLAYIYKFIMERSEHIRKRCVQIELEKNGVVQKGIGLLDTGNCLYHPWTREPVVVVEHNFLRPFFEKEEFERQENLLLYKKDCVTCKEKIIWIPFCSVGKQEGVMPGIYFEHLRLKKEKGYTDYSNALVAFCKEKIAVQGKYQMILHSSYIK